MIEIIEQKSIEESNETNLPIEEKNSINNESLLVKNNEVDIKELEWGLVIPKINVNAKIEDSTQDDVLNRSIGHFEDSPKEFGNVCLAAHNRGYKVNYFSRLKELEKGDIIYYFVNNQKYEYEVNDILIIYETDWSMLEDTKDNRITLITCVENRDEYRLCVQAIEK